VDSFEVRLRLLSDKMDSVSEKASGMLRRSRDLVHEAIKTQYESIL
jgi:hypothetical protein